MTLVVALHLALVLLWPDSANVPGDRDAEQRHFTLTWLRSPAPRVVPPPSPQRQVPAMSMARPVATPVPPPPRRVPAAVAESPDLEQLAKEEIPASWADAPRPPDGHQLREAAKRQAGAIDHALRGGKLEALAPDRDLPIARLRAALDSAYIDRSRTTVTDSMTQADGVVVYRFRRGEKVWCRQSGGIGSSIERSDGARLAGAGSAGGAGTAGNITCPSGEAGWSRL